MKTVTTDNLILRQFQPSDFDALSAVLAEAEIMQHVFSGKAYSQAESQKFVEDKFLAYENQEIGVGVLCERFNQRTVGLAGIIHCHYSEEGAVEFGFVLANFAHGKGYATEIGRSLIAYALDELNYDRLYATVHPDNSPSNRVMEKLGMKIVDKIETSDRGTRLSYCAGKCSAHILQLRRIADKSKLLLSASTVPVIG